MKETTSYPTATQESVWAAFRENERLLRESNARFEHEKTENDRRMKETERILNEKFAETDRQMKETDRQMKETDRLMKETDRLMKESSAKLDKSSADFDRRWKKLDELTGSWARNHGFFAEEYFFNAFENGQQTFFGEKFDEIEKNLKSAKPVKDEYDIVFINGKSIGIIEVKFKAHENDVPEVIRKADTFRANYPCYAQHRIFLGLASMSFYRELEDECCKQGIAIIKQVGETVVINDAHLKVY